MSQTPIAPQNDLWLAPMQAIAKADGYFKTIGDRYFAFYAEQGPKLLVSFETASKIKTRADHLPDAWHIAKKNGWSFLGLVCQANSLWQEPQLAEFFNELTEESFFDDFDTVVFAGNEAEGFAAASYSLAAPGAKVLLISPRASFDRARTPWEDRYEGVALAPAAYSYAPLNLEAASEAWLLYNPAIAQDARHAELFDQKWLQKFALHHSGSNAYRFLRESNTLDVIVTQMMAGKLTRLSLAKAWRKRRTTASYLRHLLARAENANQPLRELRICKSVMRYSNLPRFSRRLRQLSAKKEFARYL